jgi:LacI family transcriptional regulator
MSVTLDQIAAELGLSKSTISLALRDHPRSRRFSDETRRRISLKAEQMGYRPNYFATQLARSRSNLLMVCVSYLPNTWAMMIAGGFEVRAVERGYRLLIASFQHDGDPLAFQRDLLGPKGIAGMAMVGSSAEKLTDEAIRELADMGIKVVLVSRELDYPGVGQVLCDNYMGAKEAAGHVYSQGLKEVWVLAAGEETGTMTRRRRGYLDGAREWGMPAPLMLPIGFPDWKVSGYTAVRERLRRGGRPEAILSASDLSAVGAAQALSEAGLVVGRDVAVVGFDGGIYSECCTPPLTSVGQPVREMGRAAADMLIDLLERPEETATRVMLPTELLVRGSSRIVPPVPSLAERNATASQHSASERTGGTTSQIFS